MFSSLSLNCLLNEILWNAESSEGIEMWSEIGFKLQSKSIFIIKTPGCWVPAGMEKKEKVKELLVAVRKIGTCEKGC